MSEMYMDTSTDGRTRVYINRCLCDLRNGNKDKARRNFEQAWDSKNKEGCTWDTENALFILRENWWPTTGHDVMECGAKGDYYESRILEHHEMMDY